MSLRDDVLSYRKLIEESYIGSVNNGEAKEITYCSRLADAILEDARQHLYHSNSDTYNGSISIDLIKKDSVKLVGKFQCGHGIFLPKNVATGHINYKVTAEMRKAVEEAQKILNKEALFKIKLSVKIGKHHIYGPNKMDDDELYRSINSSSGVINMPKVSCSVNNSRKGYAAGLERDDNNNVKYYIQYKVTI